MNASSMKVIFRAVVSFALVALALWYFVNITWIRPAAHVTDLRRYEAVIQKLKRDRHSVTHFPDRISVAARDATFIYIPGFLQGATRLRLRLTLPPSEITAIEQRLRAMGSPLTTSELPRVCSPSFPPEWLPPQAEPGSLVIGEDFVSFLISPDLDTAKRNWNHPNNGGVSVSFRSNQVIYWLN